MSSVTVGAVLAQPSEGSLDNPIAFYSIKLSMIERYYTTTERERLVMVYALHKFQNYLLGGHFKMFAYHSTLKYLVNKPVFGRNICQWLLLFQEFDFEIIFKLGRLNSGPGHLSRLESGEEPTSLDDSIPDVELFAVKMIDDHYKDIVHLLTTVYAPKEFNTS